MPESRTEEDGEAKLRRMDLRYMHRPPRIVPNYGKKTISILPKSSVSRVLLYDNVTQQQMLDVKLTNIRVEQQKAGRLLDLHRKSFLLRRLMKHQHAQNHKTVTGVLDYLLPILLSGDGNMDPRRRPKLVHSSAGEYMSPVDEDVRLPDISEHRGARITLQHETNGGLTRVLHTIGSSRKDSGRMWAKRRTVLDGRFQGLEQLLVQLDDPGNGYIELSPSYPREPIRLPPEFTRHGSL